MTEILRKRFFSKIAAAPGSDCIFWTAGAREDGRGLMHVDGKMVSATHISWFLKHGVWPMLHVLHRCDTPACVNPEHLFEGTDLDNARDRDAKGRHRVLRGFDSASAKVDDLEISEMIALTEIGRLSLDAIGALFGVSGVYVSTLRHNRSRAAGHRAKPGRKQKASKLHDVGGRMLSVKEIAAEAGVSVGTIEARMANGKTGDELLAGKHMGPRKDYTRHR